MVSMENNTLSIDLDGVLADTINSVNKIAAKSLKRTFRKEDVTDFDLSKSNLYSDVSPKQIKWFFNEAWRNYTEIKLEDKRIPEILKDLGRYYEIWIVTGTSANDEQIKGWLERNNVFYNKLVHLDGQNQKSENMAKIHIDDYHELALMKPSCETLIILNQPWNREHRETLNGYKNVVYLDSWSEIHKFLIEKALKNKVHGF